MTASRDHDRLIRAFLEEGRTELPDASFDAIRAGIDRTRQRVVIGSWEEPFMPTLYRFLGAAAVVAVLLAGLTFVIKPIVGPQASTLPTPSVGPTASPPQAVPLTYAWPATLQAGTYVTPFSWDVPFAIEFTVPAGWQSRDIELLKGPDDAPRAAVSFNLVGNTAADPCGDLANPPIGSTPEDIAAGIAAIPGIDATVPVATNLAGRTALALEYHGLADGCPDAVLWTADEGHILPEGPHGPPEWPSRPGSHRAWVVDVDGITIVVDVGLSQGATAQERNEAQAILDSIRFVPPRDSHGYGCAMEVHEPGGPAVSAPYAARMSLTARPLQGAAPESLPPPPYAQLDFRLDALTFGQPAKANDRPMVEVMPPDGVDSAGFATLMSDADSSDAIVGSLRFDAPGTWWAWITVPAAHCAQLVSVQILAPPG